MIDINDMRDNIYLWATAISGIECFWVQDNGPKVDLPCISLQIINIVSINHVHKGAVNVITAERSLVREHHLWLKLDAFGDNAMGRLTRFTLANEFEDISNDLANAVGLSMVDNTDIQDLTGLNDSSNEERATINIRFTFGNKEDNVGTGIIENTEIEGTLIYPDDTTRIFDFEINTP